MLKVVECDSVTYGRFSIKIVREQETLFSGFGLPVNPENRSLQNNEDVLSCNRNKSLFVMNLVKESRGFRRNFNGP